MIGRPTKYKEEYCDQVIEWFKQGYSKAEICLELDICFDTLQDWAEKYPDFSEAIKKGLKFSQGWWEKQGRTGIWFSNEGERLNPTTWYMNMKNRFKDEWMDKPRQDETEAESEQFKIVRNLYKRD